MTDRYDQYESPLAGRYASLAMRQLFSARKKFTTWRRLWIALAESERELGLPITEAQLDELRATVDDVDFDVAGDYEKKLRHDVMAHVHAWGDQCPKARGILHLGATSCYVTDNTDLLILREGVDLVKAQLAGVIARLREFSVEWRSQPTLGYTHYQIAQATTVGKRATLWLQDFVHDFEDLEHAATRIRFRGVKGTTGTQASFLELFDGDHDKVRKLDHLVTERMGFASGFGVTGQTYPRQLDFRIGQALSSIAQSAHKFASDMRLLAHERELEEPFEKKQIGSSAMPWKRNPMRSERICSLSRLVISHLDNLAQTAANQWLERTLDDSANRRIVLSEMFLSIDAVLSLVLNVTAGIVVYPEVCRRNLEEALPFLASEALMMEAVKAGGDRQEIHEAVRQHAFESARRMQEEGAPNEMRDRLRNEPKLAAVAGRLDDLLDPARYVGRAPEQVLEFVEAEVDPLLSRCENLLGAQRDEVRV